MLEHDDLERLKTLARQADLPPEEFLRRLLRWRPGWGLVFASEEKPTGSVACFALHYLVPVDSLEEFLRLFPELKGQLDSDWDAKKNQTRVDGIGERMGLWTEDARKLIAKEKKEKKHG